MNGFSSQVFLPSFVERVLHYSTVGSPRWFNFGRRREVPRFHISSRGKPVVGQSSLLCPGLGASPGLDLAIGEFAQGAGVCRIARLYQGCGFIIMDMHSSFKANLQALEKWWFGKREMSLFLLAPVVFDQNLCPHFPRVC